MKSTRYQLTLMNNQSYLIVFQYSKFEFFFKILFWKIGNITINIMALVDANTVNKLPTSSLDQSNTNIPYWIKI